MGASAIFAEGLEEMRRCFGRTEVARVVPDGVDTATAKAADARRERRYNFSF